MDDAQFQNRLAVARPFDCAPQRQGGSVFGDTANGRLQGVIDHVEAQLGDRYIDVVIAVDQPGTIGGDSGLLWRNQKGQAAAIHAAAIHESGEPHLSLCMNARRISSALDQAGVDVLDLG